MLAKLRSRLRPPTAYEGFAIALAFLALGSGSYAATTVTGKNVKNSSLTGKDIKNNSVTGKDVKGIKSGDVTDRSLLAQDFKAGQLPVGPKGDKGDPGGPVAVTVRSGGPMTPGTNANDHGCVDGVPAGSKGYKDAGGTLVPCGAAAGGSAFETVECSPGEVAVSGGYTYATNKRHALVVENTPSPNATGSSPTGWRVRVETLTNDSSNATPVTPYAVCMKR